MVTPIGAAVACAVLGLVVMARATYRPRPSLADLLIDPSAGTNRKDTVSNHANGMFDRVAMWALRMLGGDLDQLTADLVVLDEDILKHARDRFATALLVSVLLAFYLSRGMLTLPPLLILAAVGAFVVVHRMQGSDTHAKANKRRASMTLLTNEIVTLLTIAVSGGAGTNTALRDALAVARTEDSQRLQAVLSSADVHGAPYAGALTEFGEIIRLNELIKFGEALEMSTVTGGSIIETLASRQEALARSVEASAMADAKRASDRMSTVMAFMAISIVGFVTYPAIANLIQI